jgi:hypothetical protein
LWNFPFHKVHDLPRVTASIPSAVFSSVLLGTTLRCTRLNALDTLQWVSQSLSQKVSLYKSEYLKWTNRQATERRFLVNDQRDAQILFYVFISIYNSLNVSSTQCSSSGETNYLNTTSGNSHSMLVAEMFIGWKRLFFQPAHISATNTEWLLPEAVFKQFVSPDDEYCVLETCREL